MKTSKILALFMGSAALVPIPASANPPKTFVFPMVKSGGPAASCPFTPTGKVLTTPSATSKIWRLSFMVCRQTRVLTSSPYRSRTSRSGLPGILATFRPIRPANHTPFNGEHNAGIQILNTGTFPDNAGPLFHLQ